jgi:APA family basic amino acid/polyamine antiporter
MTTTSPRGGIAALFRRKPVEEIETGPDAGGPGLSRTLTLRQLTAIGVGGIIGAGIFSLAGQVANETAGPAVLLSFLVAGVASAARRSRTPSSPGSSRGPGRPTPTATWCSARSSGG